MSIPNPPSPDLSKIPPPQVPSPAAPSDPVLLSELPPPAFVPTTLPAVKRPRRTGLIIGISVGAVLLLGALITVTVLLLGNSSASTTSDASSTQLREGEVASTPQAEAPAEVDAEEVEKDVTEPVVPKATPKPPVALEVPGSGAAPIPAGAKKLCVFGTTKEFEVYLFRMSDDSTSDDWVYVGGNASLGYLELPAVAVYFPGGGVAGHRMTNADGTEYYLTGHELTVTPTEGEGFYQTVRTWEQYGC